MRKPRSWSLRPDLQNLFVKKLPRERLSLFMPANVILKEPSRLQALWTSGGSRVRSAGSVP